ncbi:hypothetical protein F66182_11802, partial [Fusarium sp. NRRL 66182]
DAFDRSKLNVATDPLQQGPFYLVPGASGPFSAPAVENARFVSSAYATNEFLQFSPRKPSEVSSSTSEGDSILATVAAMGLKPNGTTDEEEIWAEYDDLVDTMLAPNKDTVSYPKISESFELAKNASKTLQAEISASDVNPRVSAASDTPSLTAADAASPALLSDASLLRHRFLT